MDGRKAGPGGQKQKEMKILTTLSALQLLLLVILTSRLLDLEAALSSYVDRQASSPHRASPVAAVAQRVGSLDSTGMPVTADVFRAIVREELAVQQRAMVACEDDVRSGPASRPLPDPDAPRRLESVRQQLDYHISMGRISDSEMAALQQQIASLDEAGRIEMLRALTRALNSGSLEGRL